MEVETDVNDQANNPSLENRPGWMGWLLILLPPFLLLPLFKTPFHMGSFFFFLAGGIAALLSTVALVAWLFRWVIAKSRKTPSQPQCKRIRSVLTLALFLLMILIHGHTRNQSDQFVLELGDQMQAGCDTKKICFFPQSILSRELRIRKPDKVVFDYDTIGPKYRVSINLPPGEMEFNAYVRHVHDTGYSVSGGVGKKVTGEHFSD